MAAPDMPLVNLTLEQYCDRGTALAADVNNLAPFVHYMLSGVDDGQLVVIDPILNGVTADDLFAVARDYDSALGFHTSIQVQNSISVKPIAQSADTLTSNVHLSYLFKNSRNPAGLSIPIHKVPNIGLGSWSTRSQLRVFLPELYTDYRDLGPNLTSSECKTFYEKGLLPAMQALMPTDATEWPVTYGDEMFRARDMKGRITFQTKMVPEYLVKDVGNYLRAAFEANDCPWGTGLVFLHQLRGLKTTTQHDDVFANQALQKFLRDNNLDYDDLMANGCWWVDSAVEVSSVAFHIKSLAWRTDSHYHLVRDLMRLSNQTADRITKPGSSQYTRDMLAHLPSVSGCRIAPGVRARGPYQVQYYQQYTTDKGLTYTLPTGNVYAYGYGFSKQLLVVDVVKGTQSEYIDGLYILYRNAAAVAAAKARLEVRVPLEYADKVLLDITPEFIQNSLVAFDITVFWNLRALRALAISYVLEWQGDGDPSLRTAKSALILTAGCVWLLNGLHSTPDKGAKSKDLMNAILPHTPAADANVDILAYGSPTADDDVDSGSSEDDEPGGYQGVATLPCWPRGLVFFTEICLGDDHPVPRLRNDITVRVETIKYFFGMNRNQLKEVMIETRRKAMAIVARVPNRVRKTANWINLKEGQERNLFKIAERGVRIPSPPRDTGSDMEIDSDEENAVNALDEDSKDVDRLMSTFWRQFLLDLTAKAPNRSSMGATSYCILSIDQRSRVSTATYQNHTLSDYFDDCAYKHANVSDWNKLFDRFFPPKSFPAFITKIQNYSNTTWWPAWNRFRERQDEFIVETCRAELRKKFHTLYWMPAATGDRIWCCRFNKSYKKLSGLPETDTSPLILINLHDIPKW